MRSAKEEKNFSEGRSIDCALSIPVYLRHFAQPRRVFPSDFRGGFKTSTTKHHGRLDKSVLQIQGCRRSGHIPPVMQWKTVFVLLPSFDVWMTSSLTYSAVVTNLQKVGYVPTVSHAHYPIISLDFGMPSYPVQIFDLAQPTSYRTNLTIKRNERMGQN